MVAWSGALRRAGLLHAEVHKVRFEVGNMMKPGSAFREGPVAAMIEAELRRPA